MDFPEIGLCLISDLQTSNDTSPYLLEKKHKDLKALKHAFETLGFTVQIESFSSKRGVQDCLSRVATLDHGQRSCFVCVVLAPEDYSNFNPSDSTEIIEHITGNKCRSLIGKPKIFFVLGYKEEDIETELQCDSGFAGKRTAKIPIHADFLYVSFRSLVQKEDPGSQYIQTLCNMLLQYGHEVNLLTLVTEVHSLIAQQCQPSELEDPPFIVNMLTKSIVFPKK
ncbi:caspase-3-like isoform 2-T2 [Discoglossus pictus]